MTMYCGRLNGAWTHIRFWRRGAICQRSKLQRSRADAEGRGRSQSDPKTQCPAREGLNEPADLEKAMFAKLRGRSDRVDPLQARPAVEIGVEAEDRVNPVMLHDGDVNGIAGGKGGSMLHDLSGTHHVRLFHREDVVDGVQKYVKCPLDGASPVDRDVTVEDFL